MNFAAYAKKFKTVNEQIETIKFLLTLSLYLKEFISANRSNFVDLEEKLIGFLMDLSKIVLPNTIFYLYTIYSPFFD